jgi:sigma-E factor negative regulatory protein RseC
MDTSPQLQNTSDFIKEKARVVSLDGDFAWIEAVAESGCHRCEVKQGCGTGLLSQIFGRRVFHHRIKNTLNAQVGDLILVSVPQSGLLLASLIIYTLPLLLLVIMALVTTTLLSLPEWSVIIWSFLGLGVGLIAARWLGRSLEQSVKTRVSMVCKVEPHMMLQMD